MLRYRRAQRVAEKKVKTLHLNPPPGESPSPTAVIQVRDHVPGVLGTDLGKIFQPFYRVPSSDGSTTSGTGLGLAITERIVRLHRGTVRAVNAPDGGLIVELTLP